MKMKQTLFIILFLLAFIQSKSQNITENDSLYLVALEKYTIEIDSFYLKYPLDSKMNFNTIFLEQADYFIKLPESINNHKLTIFNSQNEKDIYFANGNKLIHHTIFPKIENGMLKIIITPYRGEVNDKGEIILELSDWTSVLFIFDCTKKRWIYARTESDGI